MNIIFFILLAFCAGATIQYGAIFGVGRERDVASNLGLFGWFLLFLVVIAIFLRGLWAGF